MVNLFLGEFPLPANSDIRLTPVRGKLTGS